LRKGTSIDEGQNFKFFAIEELSFNWAVIFDADACLWCDCCFSDFGYGGYSLDVNQCNVSVDDDYSWVGSVLCWDGEKEKCSGDDDAVFFYLLHDEYFVGCDWV